MARITKAALMAKVDALGVLQAQIAQMKEAEEEMKAWFKLYGREEVLGNLYKVQVTNCTKDTLVADLVRGFLTAKQQKLCTKTTDYVMVSCKSLTKAKKPKSLDSKIESKV